MSDYLSRFKSCGADVNVADDVFIEHPEVMELGDNVTLARGFHMVGRPQVCRFGSHVTFFKDCYIEGSPARFVVDDHVAFYPGTYISLGGGDDSFFEVGHHSHFAARCAVYSAGGLKLGPYCNIAAHVVISTVGHQARVIDRPMAMTGEAGPITLVEDVWIGANATVTMNTTIGKGCVIGANAVVTKDAKPMGVYGGVPARYMWDRRDRAEPDDPVQE